MPKPEPITFRIYLDTGAVLEFKALDLKRTTDNHTGKLVGIEYDGAVGSDVPRYLDFDHVVAITRAAA